MYIDDKTKRRFESKYIPEPNSGCWLWTGSLVGWGYGRFASKHRTNAHRMSYMIYCEPIPDNMLVCHKCDVPSCVNPDHLFLGTTIDNINDKVRKGRARSRK